MAKFGYVCKCGWRLRRGRLTRIQYALRKQNHALGLMEDKDHPCKFLAIELARTQKDDDLRKQLLLVSKGSTIQIER